MTRAKETRKPSDQRYHEITVSDKQSPLTTTKIYIYVCCSVTVGSWFDHEMVTKERKLAFRVRRSRLVSGTDLCVTRNRTIRTTTARRQQKCYRALRDVTIGRVYYARFAHARTSLPTPWTRQLTHTHYLHGHGSFCLSRVCI